MIYTRHASQLDTKANDEAIITELHHLLLRLLQDDDESIRTGAAEIIRTGLGLKRSICQKRAMELEFEHIGFRATSSDSEETWSNLLQRPLGDDPDFSTFSGHDVQDRSLIHSVGTSKAEDQDRNH